MTDQPTTPAPEPAEPTAVEPAEEATLVVESVSAVVIESAGGVTSGLAVTASGDSAMLAGVLADEDGVVFEGAVGVEGRDAVIVAAFADEDLAKEAYHLLVAAEAAGRLHVEGVLVASCDAEGKVGIVKMTDHKTRNGFHAGAVAGAVVGLIFPPSILAGALWAGIGGAAIGKLRNLATRSEVAKELAAVLTPGSSGIIAVARLAEVAQVTAELPKATAVKAAPVSEEVADAVKEAAKAAGTAPEA